MKIKQTLSRLFTPKKVRDVFVTGSDIRAEVKEIHHEVRGDDYYVRYDAIDSISPYDRLTAEVAFVGSMR